MQKTRKEKPFYDLGKNPDINSIASLIALIDGYLANFFDDPDPYDRWIKQGALGREFAAEWRETYRTLYKIAKTIKKIPEIQKYVVAQGALRSLSVPLTLFAASLAIVSLLFTKPLGFLMLAFIMASVGAVALVLSWTAGKKVADSIDNYFKVHYEKYKFKRAYLRNVVQKLIFSLAYYLKKKDMELERYRFKLFNAYYKGIRVLKKPKLFRKRYLVTFNVKELPL